MVEFGLIIIGLSILGYVVWDITKDKQKRRASAVVEIKQPPIAHPQIQKFEPIRQMALVHVDEFETFYLPIIEKIKCYEALVNQPPGESIFIELVFKALRTKRAAIFETDSAESNNTNAPFWTLGLFLAIMCRYTVRLLNSSKFRDASKQPINPFLERFEALAGLEIKYSGLANDYTPNTIYIHLLEKIIPVSVIKMLADKQIYPYVVNAVTGYYGQRNLPFYRIIEAVEEHVHHPAMNTADVTFDRTVSQVMRLIENNTVIKNTIEALIFESNTYLYIDRYLLWEMFKTYHVFEQGSMTKKSFEQRLIERLSLSKTSTLNAAVRVYSVESKTQIVQGSVSYIEVNNTIALPYSKLSTYSPTQRLRIEQQRVQREVVIESITDSIRTHENKHSKPKIKTQRERLKLKPDTLSRSEKQQRSNALFDEN